ncbi:MAG: hypothetical protein JWP17_3006 [Solirubrobacterales bacterium]|nr:hypothetical protein [Solirubrobacterales bacterium]
MDRDPERQRRDGEQRAAWRRFGPYLSERQWGTVREDTSEDGDAWSSFPHDHARSRAYRWGEDGIAGLGDDHGHVCLSLALWNGNDPILKERMFGLTNPEGNHGEDVKEYWFYLDATPTASYLKVLYKYPQAAFPYAELIARNAARGRDDFEYELLDTGVFDEERYFDVVVEYAKDGPDDVLMLVSATNHGPDPAPLHLLPQLWFRNSWGWGNADGERPSVRAGSGEAGAVDVHHRDVGDFVLRAEADAAQLLFTENDTNTERLYGRPNPTPYVKDAFDAYVVRGDADAVNPARTGTKVAAHHVLTIAPGATETIRIRLSAAELGPRPLDERFDAVVQLRRDEAQTFYEGIARPGGDVEHARVLRQSLAGMLWSQQYFGYDVITWLRARGESPWTGDADRNGHWFHMRADDVISMPDTWEYPWFAAWDLAFQSVALALVDLALAKEQIELLLRDDYQHGNGQIPAYEWNFSDVNPPVQAWAAYFVYQTEQRMTGRRDTEFLERVFHRLVANFTWWVNRKDPDDRNVYQGGFLGLDNIGVFDRSAPLPGGGTLEQADGTAWMAVYAQLMAQIAQELARDNRAYLGMAWKYVEHFLWIAAAMDGAGDGHGRLWSEEDGFFYDVIRRPDGSEQPLKVRSLVGLLPLCASIVFEPEVFDGLPGVADRIAQFAQRFGEDIPFLRQPHEPGVNGRHLLSLLDEDKLRRILAVMLDEDEFLSDFGIRSLSRRHLEHPYEFHVDGQTFSVGYLPAESDTGMFGGNSNWRGPIWFPMNVMLLRGLVVLHRYYGEAFTIECPTGSGTRMTLAQVAAEISRRMISIFTPGEDGRRPVYGGTERFQEDPAWKDLLLFFEYFHGDDGAGLGASHQTGWTGLVATMTWMYGSLDEHAEMPVGLSADL